MKKRIVSENYAGRFMNNVFEGYGIFRVKYESHDKESLDVGDKNGPNNNDLKLEAQQPAEQPEEPVEAAPKYFEDVYEGEWRNSLKHGNGTEKYCNGDYYIGHFREGEFDGTGKYIWSNGSTYSGQFKKGKKHGRGKWIVKDKVI